MGRADFRNLLVSSPEHGRAMQTANGAWKLRGSAENCNLITDSNAQVCLPCNETLSNRQFLLVFSAKDQFSGFSRRSIKSSFTTK
jgi:hypothetical protein